MARIKKDWKYRLRLAKQKRVEEYHARKAAEAAASGKAAEGEIGPSGHVMKPGMTIGPDGIPKFAKGNALGKGKGGWSATHQIKRDFQKAFFSAVTDDDIREIAQACVKEAKKGNLIAAREVFDRCMGKPDDTMVVKRLHELEELYVNGRKPPPEPLRLTETA